MPLKAIPCTIMRGGTSKGLFFRREHLPSDPAERERVLLKIFGSGDHLQIDGLGCAFPQASKTMIVWRSEHDSIDVEYLFGQVGIEKRLIDWTGNCGNLTSAVGPFAIEEGLVEPKEPYTVVRAFNVNTRKRIDIVVPVENGRVKYDGDYMIDGVPNPGSRIDCMWYDPGGAVIGKGYLPTGNVKDFIEVDGKAYEVSIVDAANPVVFVRAEDVGIKGIELPNEVSKEAMITLEKIRSKAAQILGLVDDWTKATDVSPHMPFIATVSERQDYVTTRGKSLDKNDYNVLVRLFSMQRMHPTIAVTAAICIASAAKISGTIVNEYCDSSNKKVVIGHPAGVMEVEVHTTGGGVNTRVEKVVVGRTARLLMRGFAYYID